MSNPSQPPRLIRPPGYQSIRLTPTSQSGQSASSSAFASSTFANTQAAPPSGVWRGSVSAQTPTGLSTRIRSTMDPAFYEERDKNDSLGYSALPGHLSRNTHPGEQSVKRDLEQSVVRSKEEDEEDRKLREKEKTLSWDDRRRLADNALRVREEVISTEKTYVEKLHLLNEAFVQPLINSSLEDLGIVEAHRTALLSNLQVIINFQDTFYKDLLSGGFAGIEKVIIQYSHFFRIYSTYATEYSKILDTQNALAGSKKFQAFLTMVDKRLLPDGNGAEQLMSFLILPIQRIPRYELLLKELKKNTVPSSPEFDEINKGLSLIKSTATHINEARKKVQHMNTLVQIQRRIKGDIKELELIKPFRKLIRESEIKLSEPKKKSIFGTIKSNTRILFLFNDILLWTNKDMVYKSYIHVAGISSLIAIDDTTLELTTSEKLIIAVFKSNQEMREWVDDLNTQINEQQEARRMKRSIQSRGENSRTTTHKMIVRKFSTLDPQSVRENGDLEQSVSRMSLNDNSHQHNNELSVSTTNDDSTSSNMPPQTPSAASGNGVFRVRQVASRRTLRADEMKQAQQQAQQQQQQQQAE